MLVAFTELKNAQKVKEYLVKKKLISGDFLPQRILDKMFFPIIKKVKIPNAKTKNVKFKFEKRIDKTTILDILQKKLSKKEIDLLPKSQEIVGNILILEIPNELIKKEKLIAEAYLKLSPNINTVVKKTRIHSGVYRTREVKILAGKRTKETIHNENGVKIKLHLEKTYFSARSGNERLRISKQIKNGEKVLVMFSGAAPYPLVISKNSSAKKIYGIEINPLAHEYAVDNLEINNIKNVIIHRGDVRKVLPKLIGKYDRIVMPLPKTSEEYLEIALTKVKNNGMVHLYSFLNEDNINSEAKKIKNLCKKSGKDVRILKKVKCGSFSPSVFRICFDIKIKK